MPTVLRFDSLRAAIYFNDHRPAHVHVTGGGNSAVIDLRCPHGPPRIRERYGFKSSELRRIEAAVAAELASLAESAAPVADGIHEPDAPDPRLKAAARPAKPRGAIEIDLRRCYNYLLYWRFCTFVDLWPPASGTAESGRIRSVWQNFVKTVRKLLS